MIPAGSQVIARVYALGLILAILVVALTPIHGALTANLWVIRGLPDHRVAIAVDDYVPGVGQRIPITRHNPDWIYPIGHATVESVHSDTVIARYDPATFRWPMGRHATVVEHTGQHIVIDAGRRSGFEAGLTVYGYVDHDRVLEARVQLAEADRATAVVLSRSGASGDLTGIGVTEYTVRTRASPLTAPWLRWLEALALIAAVLTPMIPGAGRAGASLGGRIRAAIERIGRIRGAPVVLDLALTPLVALVVVPFGATTITFLASATARTLAEAGRDVAVPPPFPEGSVAPLQVAAVIAYLAWIALTRTSPWIAGWRALSYRPAQLPGSEWTQTVGLWALHLIIAWAFASTLTGFLAGNLEQVGHLLWPGASISLADPASAMDGLRIAATTAPRWPGTVGSLQVSRYLLWSLTICGCLVGYGHTVVSILWKRPLLALDFTVAGWITNAVCYGPLLGAVVHHLLPDGDYTGVDPMVTEGPLYPAILITEVLVNALYTASIWNLGTYFGVMSYKGLRTTGFYAVVRHPSYTLEPLMFVLMMLPGLSGPWTWISAGSFLIKYWIRAEREEHFLATVAGSDHAAYRRLTPHKYIPGWV